MHPEDGSFILTVDGERFEVEATPDRRGQYHFGWLSGPNPKYGFGTASSDGSLLDHDQMVEQIRSFLRQVDPATGYIE